MKFYEQKRWRRKRITILKRDDYECRECRRYGRTRVATHVHHILPLRICMKKKPLLAWETFNLISLCNECHEAMHDRLNDCLTDKGCKLAAKVVELEKYLEGEQ